MELENKSGKTNKPEPANKPEKAILLSRACAVIMIILYAGVLLRYDIRKMPVNFLSMGWRQFAALWRAVFWYQDLKL